MLAASLLLTLSCAARAQTVWPPAVPVLAPLHAPPAYSAAELETALLSPSGADQVRQIFEKAMAQAAFFKLKVPIPRVGGEWAEDRQIGATLIIPSIGGTLSLRSGRLALAPLPDATRPLLRQLALHADDAAALQAVYAAHPQELSVVDGDDSMHLLRHMLDNIPNFPQTPDKDARIALALGRTVLSVVENGAEDYAHGWSGTGERWHIHPPHFRKAGWFVGEAPGDDEGSPEPSPFDRELAGRFGQNLTLVFQPDGFDAYDLAFGGKIAYRSDDWRRHFAAVHQQLAQMLANDLP